MDKSLLFCGKGYKTCKNGLKISSDGRKFVKIITKITFDF